MALSNQEILEKAIQKAIDGGWDRFGNDDYSAKDMAHFAFETAAVYPWSEIIFNHDFAKVLWGEHWSNCSPPFTGGYPCNLLNEGNNPGWQHHLQMMVIADDPIKYLGDTMDKEL